MKYGVKVVYTYLVVEENKRFFEESILLVEACSFDDALCKAETFANDRDLKYVNCAGNVVKLQKIDVLDSFLVDDVDEIVEIYSSFSLNKTSLSDDDYYTAITDIATSDDLTSLRYK